MMTQKIKQYTEIVKIDEHLSDKQFKDYSARTTIKKTVYRIFLFQMLTKCT